MGVGSLPPPWPSLACLTCGAHTISGAESPACCHRSEPRSAVSFRQDGLLALQPLQPPGLHQSRMCNSRSGAPGDSAFIAWQRDGSVWPVPGSWVHWLGARTQLLVADQHRVLGGGGAMDSRWRSATPAARPERRQCGCAMQRGARNTMCRVYIVGCVPDRPRGRHGHRHHILHASHHHHHATTSSSNHLTTGPALRQTAAVSPHSPTQDPAPALAFSRHSPSSRSINNYTQPRRQTSSSRSAHHHPSVPACLTPASWPSLSIRGGLPD